MISHLLQRAFDIGPRDSSGLGNSKDGCKSRICAGISRTTSCEGIKLEDRKGLESRDVHRTATIMSCQMT